MRQEKGYLVVLVVELKQGWRWKVQPSLYPARCGAGKIKIKIKDEGLID
jgi:hypothetical protein